MSHPIPTYVRDTAKLHKGLTLRGEHIINADFTTDNDGVTGRYMVSYKYRETAITAYVDYSQEKKFHTIVSMSVPTSDTDGSLTRSGINPHVFNDELEKCVDGANDYLHALAHRDGVVCTDFVAAAISDINYRVFNSYHG